MFALFGILSGLLAFAADIPYFLDTIKGKTKPHRVSWFTFFLLNIIFLFNQRASGATNSMWLIAGFTIATLLIFLASLKYGVGGYSKSDIICLSGIVVGLLLWAYFKTPLASLLANLAVASIALVPTAIKAYKYPETETRITWLVAGLADLLGAVAVHKLDYRLLLFPVYGFIAQLSVFILVELGTAAKR